VNERLSFTFAGRACHGRRGDTIATALWATGVRDLRASARLGEPRGPFCCMGVCFDCLVRVAGTPVRACTTPLRHGMVVERIA
jgi:hypothetical protein